MKPAKPVFYLPDEKGIVRRTTEEKWNQRRKQRMENPSKVFDCITSVAKDLRVVTLFPLVPRVASNSGLFWRTTVFYKEKIIDCFWCGGSLEQAEAQHDRVGFQFGVPCMFARDYPNSIDEYPVENASYFLMDYSE